MSDGIKTIRYAGELKEYLLNDVDMICVWGNEKIVKTYKEVIFCKDCIYNDRGWCGAQEYGTRHVEDNDYCSYGERKEQEHVNADKS